MSYLAFSCLESPSKAPLDYDCSLPRSFWDTPSPKFLQLFKDPPLHFPQSQLPESLSGTKSQAPEISQRELGERK